MVEADREPELRRRGWLIFISAGPGLFPKGAGIEAPVTVRRRVQRGD
jgi:hypothetical protein